MHPSFRMRWSCPASGIHFHIAWQRWRRLAGRTTPIPLRENRISTVARHRERAPTVALISPQRRRGFYQQQQRGFLHTKMVRTHFLPLQWLTYPLGDNDELSQHRTAEVNYIRELVRLRDKVRHCQISCAR